MTVRPGMLAADMVGKCKRFPTKATYTNIEAARRFARGKDLHAYHCKHCGWFHLSKMTRRQHADAKRGLHTVRETTERVALAAAMVGVFFGDEKTAALWMRTENPMLGGVSPLDMIESGRGDKLLEWMREALAENEQ